MTLTAFVYATLALLIAPGPTNTLMGVAGAQGGMRRVVRLLPFELAGYLTAILPLVILGAALMDRWPAAAGAVQLLAAVWVAVLALRLWGLRVSAAGAEVMPWQVYVTTALNPKALVFGLVLLPSLGAAEFPARLALFCLSVTAVAMIWGGCGAMLQAPQNGGRLQWVQRMASVWLGFVAVSLVAGVVNI